MPGTSPLMNYTFGLVTNYQYTSPSGVVVSTSAYRAGGDGFESHVGQFSYNSLMVMSQAYDVNS